MQVSDLRSTNHVHVQQSPSPFNYSSPRLAVSRSLGDYFFKSTKGAEPWGQPIICKPDVIIEERKEDDEFILCCCDGVWDVMTNEQATEFVRER